MTQRNINTRHRKRANLAINLSLFDGGKIVRHNN